jgi:peptidyl-prolyl cis-trans isomerase D
MIGTIRKHSKWLWWLIAGLTIISFIGWNIAPANRNNNGGGGGGKFGTLYGHKITQQEYVNARNEFYIFYFFRNYEWPDRNPNIKEKDLDEQIYLRLMLTQKARTLGIYVSDEAAAMAASQMLQSPGLARELGLSGQAVPLQAFVKLLASQGLNAEDFARLARTDLVIQQLVQMLGISGSLITPQEATDAYQRARQEVSAQIVFFTASNYVPQVAVTPAVIAEFYTNHQAAYRLPDRVQVNYVEFNVSNFMAAAEQTLGKTNLDNETQALFNKNGMEAVPEAKTPEEAKAKIRDFLIRQRAIADARAKANDFANAVVNLAPQRPENLATVAKQMGLTVQTTAPFGSAYGPTLSVPASFTKSAFALTPDDPFAGPIEGTYAFYEIAFDKKLDSTIPPLDQIRSQVTQDYQTLQATLLAQRAGTNFASGLGQLAAGQNFPSVCIAAGLHPEQLPPFSLSTQELPELAGRTSVGQLQHAAFGTPVGRASNFEPTDNNNINDNSGGFVLYVQSRLPLDQTAMKTDLPQFTAGLRRQRESEAFNQWVQVEASRQLRNTPLANGAK